MRWTLCSVGWMSYKFKKCNQSSDVCNKIEILMEMEQIVDTEAKFDEKNCSEMLNLPK